MPSSSSSPTVGLRTWQRTDASVSSALADRVTETTRTADPAVAIAEADFVTIPRLTASLEDDGHEGYDDAYADAVCAALSARFGYAGGRRVSSSGLSHVFERERIQNGLSVDLGLPSMITTGPVSGDGLLRGIPALVRH